jgi:prepilin-type N-terminal cleavage/methylation domain-containing protein
MEKTGFLQVGGQEGFTLLEIVAVLAIISILAATVIISYDKMAMSTQLEKDVLTVYKELSSLKTLVMKFDKQTKAVFSSNKVIINKISRSDTLKLQTPVTFANAASGPSSTPFNQTITAGSGGKGLWKDSLVVRRDAICSIDSGYVLMSSSKVKSITYYLGVSGKNPGIQLYKWTGGSWVKQ